MRIGKKKEIRDNRYFYTRVKVGYLPELKKEARLLNKQAKKNNYDEEWIIYPIPGNFGSCQLVCKHPGVYF